MSKKLKSKEDGTQEPVTIEKKKKKRKQTEDGEKKDEVVTTEKKKKKRKLEDEPSESKKKKRKREQVCAAASDIPSQAQIDEFLSQNHINCVPPITPYLSFTSVPIPSSLSSPLSRFPAPTPIQACTWPSALAGKDIVGIAETGSGKTLAFGIPALAKLLAHPPATDGIRTLVLAPTRELAMQTHGQLVALGEPLGIGCVAVYGGAPKDGQARQLREATARIVVGTPGRILDFVGDGVCVLGAVDCLVLDEADRMLDSGFENAIREIIGCTRAKGQRQTMMFSATWPDSVRRLADTFLTDPARVTVGSEDLAANSRVEQNVEVFEDERSKDGRLLKHLHTILPAKDKPSNVRVLVFALYKPETSRVAEAVHRAGYRVCALHGDMKQAARTAALADFTSGRASVMVATDVAARGLDIPGVEVVINYTFPLTVEDYVHRIGRTGRGGRFGKAITFFTGQGPYEKNLAGEYAKLLTEGGYQKEAAKLQARFPMTIKKKEHSAYGAFFRDDIEMPVNRKKIVF